MVSTLESLWNILEWVSRGKSVICDDWQATFHMSETSWMPHGEIPQKIQIQPAFFAASYFGHQKTGGNVSTRKFIFDFNCQRLVLWRCVSIKLRSVISKTQFFDWGACKLMKPCEKRNCCLAQNYFSYQAISECWYFMDPCHTCHAEFGWQAAALKGPGSSTRFDLHEKHVVGLYPAIRTDEDALLWCIPDLKDGLILGRSCLVGRLIPTLDDNKCGVPLGKKKCWNIEYTEHHVMFENEYIISIWDRPASHMVPYVISVVAEGRAPWIYWKPQNTIPTWHTRDLLSISGWRHVCPCGHWLAGGAAQRVGSNRCTHPGLICWGYNPPGSPSFPFPRW